jgi:hypothetical protein
MRIGRQIELLLACYKTYKGKGKDDVINLTTMAKQGFFSLWLGFDTLSWIQAIGLVKVEPEDKKTTSNRAYKFWLAGLTAVSYIR